MTKASTRTISEWKGHVMSSVNEKNPYLKNKITCRPLKPIFTEHEVKNTVFPIERFCGCTY